MIDKITDFLPSDSLFFIFYLFGFLFVSVILIFILGRKAKNNESKKETKFNLDDIFKIAKNPKSTTKDLAAALMIFKENFKIEDNESKIFEFFENVLNHKNRNKTLFDYFHNEIIPMNKKYKIKLDEIERKALNRD